MELLSGGGFYLKRKSEPRIVGANTNGSNEWVTVLNLTGELLLLRADIQKNQNDGTIDDEKRLKITIDGEVLPEIATTTSSVIGYLSNETTSTPIYVRKSIKVEMRYGGSGNMSGRVDYVLVEKSKI